MKRLLLLSLCLSWLLIGASAPEGQGCAAGEPGEVQDTALEAFAAARQEEDVLIYVATIQNVAASPHILKHENDKVNCNDVLDAWARTNYEGGVSFCSPLIRVVLLEMSARVGVIVVERATGIVITSYASSHSLQYETKKQIERGLIRCN